MLSGLANRSTSNGRSQLSKGKPLFTVWTIRAGCGIQGTYYLFSFDNSWDVAKTSDMARITRRMGRSPPFPLTKMENV